MKNLFITASLVLLAGIVYRYLITNRPQSFTSTHCLDKHLQSDENKESMDDFYPCSAFFNGGVARYEKLLDSKGVSLFMYNSRHFYHPTVIASYALDLYADYLKTRNKDYKQKFLIQAEWLNENFEVQDNLIVWPIPFENRDFELEANYTSALTNAWCSAVLLLASQFVPFETYAKNAHLGMQYLVTPMKKGGGLGHISDSSIWFEEYPDIEHPSHVLNGNIFAIEVIDLFRKVRKEKMYSSFFENSIQSLEQNIDKFVLGYGSIYDLKLKANKIGSRYHKIHYEQLLWLYYETGNEIFLKTAKICFDQELQNEYLVNSHSCIDCKKNGVDQLNKNYWYGHWSSNDELIELHFEFDTIKTTYQLNLFGISKQHFPQTIKIISGDKSWIINLDNIEYNGSNFHKNYNTFVKSVVLQEEILNDKISLQFMNKDKRVIALRNIGFLQNNRDEFCSDFEKKIATLNWNQRKYYNNQIISNN